jgi:glucose uptake protein GlcU
VIKLVKFLVSCIGILQIVIGSTLAGILIGFIIYYLKADSIGFTIAIVVAGLSFIAGIFWATRVAKKQNPADYVSQIRASSDLNGENPDFFHR